MSLLDAAQGVWLIANRGHYTVDVLTSLMLCVVTEQVCKWVYSIYYNGYYDII